MSVSILFVSSHPLGRACPPVVHHRRHSIQVPQLITITTTIHPWGLKSNNRSLSPLSNPKHHQKKKKKPHSQQIRKNNHIPKSLRNPHQIERILLHPDPLRQRSRIVTTQPTPSIRIHAYTKISNSHFQLGGADDVGDGGNDVRIDLGRTVGGRVGGVVEGNQEDVGDAGGGGGAAC